MSGRRVGVCYGGPSPEHDVSILTGLQALRGLLAAPAIDEIHSLYWSKTGEWFEVRGEREAGDYLAGVPREAEALRLEVGPRGGFYRRGGRLGRPQRLELDAVIVCCHGGPGEDGTLQGLFDLCGLSYSGPTLAGALVGMDKLAFSALMTAGAVAALPRAVMYEGAPEPSFAGPYIVKPRFGGSSIGIDVVSDYRSGLARLGANRHLTRGAVIEPYRPELFDLQVAVRSYPDVELSAIERPIRHEGGEILGFADKYVGSEGMASAPHELPAKIEPALAEAIRQGALRVAALCQVRGVCRIDFLTDGERAYVNEVNTIPGSLSRHLFVDPPLPFAKLLGDLVEEALSRPAAAISAEGADGLALSVAGSIRGKLA